ncbi:MAG: hypothetical protein ACYS8Z_21475 [Planctomycetota bacterium]|jgi:dihydroorotase
MDSGLLIKNGRVIDPANNIDKKCDVLVGEGVIAQVGKIEGAQASAAETVIDARGLIVCPGLIKKRRRLQAVLPLLLLPGSRR